MRIRSAVAAVATVALAMGMTSYAGAATDDPDTVDPGAEAVVAPTEESAEQALEEAELLFDEDPVTTPAGDRDATLVLRDLALSRDKLGGAQRASADRMLARPAAQKKKCAKHVCVHWASKGQHRVAKADRRPRNGTPDYVDKVLKTMEQVHKKYVKAGYRAPKTDTGQGGNRKRDIYLRNIGPQGFYGYCTSDRNARTVAAYCVLDNDYRRAEFPTNTPLENMKVTAAHEYFHAVQFAYDYYEDGWLMEATATWAEDELYDSVNDNVNYLDRGQMGASRPGTFAGPRHALDGFWDGNFYGNWIFFRYLTERMTSSKAGMPVLVRDIWRRAGDGDYSLRAVARELDDRGRDFGDTYASFAEANRRSRSTYSEGQSQRYPTSQTWFTQTLTPTNTPAAKSVRLDHLTSATARFLPDTGLSGASLEITANMANLSQGSRLIVTTVTPGGTARAYRVAVGATGSGTRTVSGFDNYKYVEVTLVNASRSFTGCGNGDPTYGDFTYSCNGTPRDDGLAQVLTVDVAP